MAFTPIETQEQFDEMVQERIGRAKDSVRKEYEGYVKPEDVEKKLGDLQKQLGGSADTVKSLTEEKAALEAQIEEANTKIAKYENDSVKTKVATEYGLPIDAIPFLQGTDEETIKASAESLKGLVGANNVPPMASTEVTPPDDETTAFKSMIGEMFKD